MMPSYSLKIMLCGGSKTSPYLIHTYNLKYTLHLRYIYSENKKWKNKNKLQRRLLNDGN